MWWRAQVMCWRPVANGMCWWPLSTTPMPTMLAPPWTRWWSGPGATSKKKSGGSGPGAGQAVAHAIPLQRVGRGFHPNEPDALGVHLAQLGKQLMRSGLGMAGHAMDRHQRRTHLQRTAVVERNGGACIGRLGSTEQIQRRLQGLGIHQAHGGAGCVVRLQGPRGPWP